jgi:hypothetical protein
MSGNSLPRQPRPGRQSARSRPRAVKHVAAGGWMTARWSSVLPNDGGDASSRRGSEGRALTGSPTAVGGQSPERVFAAGARDANVGCRNGFQAPWRCTQEGRTACEGHRRAKEETVDLDGAGRHPLRGKVLMDRSRSSGTRKRARITGVGPCEVEKTCSAPWSGRPRIVAGSTLDH